MVSPSRPASARVTLAAVVVLLLGACGGTSTTSTTGLTPTPSPPGTTASSSTAPVGTNVGVSEKEFSIILDTTSFATGTYTFMVENHGAFPHNLTIEGPGVDKMASATLQGGQSGSVTVSLQKGSYELWCSVDSHKDKGMDLTITVG